MNTTKTIATPMPAPSTAFHGTAANYIDMFRKNGPQVRRQPHLVKPAFCTSTDFKEAERFAIRHTPANDLSAVGIVLEYDATAATAKDFAHAKDTRTMWEEKEVAFYKTGRLKLVAVWRLMDHGWKRTAEAA